MKKIIFLDVDGTLVDYENKLPLSAVMAVRKAREKGSRVYICTGRSRAEIPAYLWDIGLDGMIGGNGSYVEDNGRVVMHQTLSYEQTKKAVDWLHEQGLEFYLESVDEDITVLSEKYSDNCRMYMSLGVMAGLFLTIILI